MSNVTISGLAPNPATIDKAGTHLLAPVVDGIIRRFNDDATRAEAALSAVALLQTLKAMGIFFPPVQANVATARAPAFGGSTQRPVVNPDVLQKMQDELNSQKVDEFTRT